MIPDLGEKFKLPYMATCHAGLKHMDPNVKSFTVIGSLHSHAKFCRAPTGIPTCRSESRDFMLLVHTYRFKNTGGSRDTHRDTQDEHTVAHGTSTQSQTANPTSTKPTHTQTGPHIRDSTHRRTGKHTCTSTRKTYQYQSVRPKLQSPAVPRTQTTYFHQLNEELSSNENVHNALKLAWATWHTQ